MADNLVWDIDKSIVNLYGNIKLSYLRTKLQSNTAKYNDSLDKILFSGLTKYTVYTKKEKTRPLLKLTSQKAVIDYKSKQILFVSSGEQVKSIVNIGIEQTNQ